ncbi:MAG: solute:sodium symporter family transporter [Polaribacter sp.]|uniref:solute:sodium symporter family transporter n=1 Tax=Polaribacter sp. TaxID=1920175 RepID=UPI003BB06228
MQFITFIGFTALVAIISYLATRSTDENSKDGYFLGGRSLTGIVIAGSLLLTNLSTEQIVGLSGQAYEQGILVMAWETLAAITMVIIAAFLLPRYLKGGIATIPQFLQHRYDKTTKAIVSGLFLSGYVTIFLPVVLYTGASAINTMFDVPTTFGISENAALWVTIFGIGVIGSIYAVFGGLKAVAVSDTINAVGLIIGGLMIPYFGLCYIGDGSMLSGMDILMSSHPEKFDSTGSENSYVPLSTLFTGMLLVNLFYWGTNQAIIQRALGAKNLVEGQKGLVYGAFLKILGPLILVLPGIIAFHIFEGNLAKPDLAYASLVSEVLPKPLVGFFAAVLFGAILSSFNSALNSCVTLFGIDIYQEYFKKEASEKEVVKAGKTFGVFLAILSMLVAPFIANAGSVFEYLQEINGTYSIPILTIVVVGYTTKFVPALAAKVGLISGVILYSISQFIIKPNYNVLEMVDGIEVVTGNTYPHFLHIMAILFVLNIIIMLVIGKVYPRKVAYVQHNSHEVDITPWKYLKPVGGFICLIVIVIYVYFAK